MILVTFKCDSCSELKELEMPWQRIGIFYEQYNNATPVMQANAPTPDGWNWAGEYDDRKLICPRCRKD